MFWDNLFGVDNDKLSQVELSISLFERWFQRAEIGHLMFALFFIWIKTVLFPEVDFMCYRWIISAKIMVKKLVGFIVYFSNDMSNLLLSDVTQP